MLCGLAAAYCLARCVVPAWHAADHGIDVDAWHVVMGAGMVLMLAGAAGRATSVLFVAGVGSSAFVLAAAVAVGVAAVSAGRAVPASDVRARLGLGCEVVMAVAMGWMALG